ncbi:hypothetical protein R3I93_009983 [Phoxinus phoxinus]|uniref:Uncharacterized protein n=1 Tax=Phoxinus phoxinus TaxID=58324 RepID=A0AAN9H8W7_9TELE
MTRIFKRRRVPFTYLPMLSVLISVTVNFGKALCGCWQESLSRALLARVEDAKEQQGDCLRMKPDATGKDRRV